MNDLIGRILLGRYRIESLIGTGGMADVYKGHDLKLGRPVAIKVLPPPLARDSGLARRFKQEARAGGQLDHPNIVTIHDVGEEGGILFFVMNYVEGRTLKEMIEEQGALPLSRVVNIIIQVASALDHAHKLGYVHRDIKPSNIIVDDAGHATLTDFGIVRALDGTRLTTTGATAGTPLYMSPEQCKGEAIDKRSDVYSLGVVLYEILTGRVPFAAENTPAILHAHVYEPPPSVRNLRGGLPEAVESVVRRSLAKDPGQRYITAGEMARALAAAIQVRGTEPPTVRAEATMARRPPSRWSLWAIPVGVAGIVILIVGLWASFGRGTESRLVPAVPYTPTPSLAASPTYTSAPALTSLPGLVPLTPTPSPPPATATPTIRPTLAPTATYTPTLGPPTPTFTSTTVLTPTAIQLLQAPNLLLPEQNFSFGHQIQTVVLLWSWTRPLQPDERYEIQMWRPGEPEYTPVDWRTDTKTIAWRDIWFPGTTLWRIVVVRQDASGIVAISEPSEVRKFSWEAPEEPAPRPEPPPPPS